jgi:NADH dehydrogenase FAD-containing subunit
LFLKKIKYYFIMELTYDHLVFATGAETSYLGWITSKKTLSHENAE